MFKQGIFRHGFMLLVLLSFDVSAEKEEVELEIPGATKVTAERIFELYEELDDLVIVDSRKPADRANGYIEESIALPDFDTNAESLAEHLASKSTPVVFYCNGPRCGRSGNAVRKALELGYNRVFWFRGGWKEWTENDFPFVKD